MPPTKDSSTEAPDASGKVQEIAKEQSPQKIQTGTSADGIKVARPGGTTHPNSQQALALSEEMLVEAVRAFKSAKGGLKKGIEYWVTAQRMAGVSESEMRANALINEAIDLYDVFDDEDEDAAVNAIKDKTKIVGLGHENDDNKVTPDLTKRMEGGGLVPPTPDVTTAMNRGVAVEPDHTKGAGVPEAQSAGGTAPHEPADSEDGLDGGGPPA